MGSSTQVLEAKGVRYSTPDGRCLQGNLSFALRSGQVLLIRGENGCGKSTLIKVMQGEWPLDAGSLDVVTGRERRQHIPQLENTEIHFPLSLRDVLSLSSRRPDWRMVERLGLVRSGDLDKAWNTASGGERRRTLLTRALLADPTLLVLDEPMNHLDRDSRGLVIVAMEQFLRGGEGRSIVMVCHQGLEPEEASRFDLRELNLSRGGMHP